MKLKELYLIKETLSNYRDFTAHNGDSDESGIVEEMFRLDDEATRAIEQEIVRIRWKNGRARAKRYIQKQKKV